MTYETILAEHRGRVLLITLNRPEVLNALNATMAGEIVEALVAAEIDDAIGCIVITGSDKAFAAGADIKEMQPKGFAEVYVADQFGLWDRVPMLRKPVIAAVSGYALGGGCELAMMCDFILCSDTARFGQPEVKLGIMPGMGGTQRLTRLVGQAKAMEMNLTGRMMTAEEAERAGLVSRVVPSAELLDEALKVAETIAGMSLPSTMSIRDATRRSQEISLAEGVRHERRLLQALFGTDDKAEGMIAFIEKRKPVFKHR
ncbi:enoyl-CoA hydratase [Seohaeicola zhoushanensis]